MDPIPGAFPFGRKAPYLKRWREPETFTLMYIYFFHSSEYENMTMYMSFYFFPPVLLFFFPLLPTRAGTQVKKKESGRLLRDNFALQLWWEKHKKNYSSISDCKDEMRMVYNEEESFNLVCAEITGMLTVRIDRWGWEMDLEEIGRLSISTALHFEGRESPLQHKIKYRNQIMEGLFSVRSKSKECKT